MGKFIKDAIIVLLICLVAMLGLAVGLYQFIPSRKVVPEVKQYYATEEVRELKDENTTEKITTYSFPNDSTNDTELKVTSSDLDGYETTNDYVPGKINPFSEYSGKTAGSPDDAVKPEEKTDEENTNDVKKEPAVYSSSSGTK